MFRNALLENSFHHSCTIIFFFCVINMNVYGRVTIEGAGQKFIMEGQNLTLKCKNDHPTSNLTWFNSSKHQLTAKVGSIHISDCQLLHHGSSESVLTFVNITTDKRGFYTCGTNDKTYDVDVIVLSVQKDRLAYQHLYNLTCELYGFTHNFPQIYAWWKFPSGLTSNISMSGFEIGTSRYSHENWLVVDVRKNPGTYFCIFGLPTTEGSFIANDSFTFSQLEPINMDDYQHNSMRNIQGATFFIICMVVAIAIGAINRICDHRTTDEVHDTMSQHN